MSGMTVMRLIPPKTQGSGFFARGMSHMTVMPLIALMVIVERSA